MRACRNHLPIPSLRLPRPFCTPRAWTWPPSSRFLVMPAPVGIGGQGRNGSLPRCRSRPSSCPFCGCSGVLPLWGCRCRGSMRYRCSSGSYCRRIWAAAISRRPSTLARRRRHSLPPPFLCFRVWPRHRGIYARCQCFPPTMTLASGRSWRCSRTGTCGGIYRSSSIALRKRGCRRSLPSSCKRRPASPRFGYTATFTPAISCCARPARW